MSETRLGVDVGGAFTDLVALPIEGKLIYGEGTLYAQGSTPKAQGPATGFGGENDLLAV